MRTCKYLLISFLFLLFIGPVVASPNEKKLDTTAPLGYNNEDRNLCIHPQIDSIIRMEINKNLETLITVKTYECLGYYISEQNNHHEQENNRLAWIAILVTIVALAGPFVINRHFEKWIDKNLEDMQKYTNWYMTIIENQIEKTVNDTLSTVDQKVKQYTDASEKDIKEEIANGLLKVNNTIASHENNLNQLTNQVKSFADDAKKSEERANTIAKDIELVKTLYQLNTENDILKQIEILLHINELNPSDSYASKALAEKYASIQDYANAITRITEYINIRPFDPYGYSCRAKYYLLNNCINEAMNDFSLAIKNDPSNDAWYYERGKAYEDSNQLENALRDYSMAKDIASKNDGGINTYLDAIRRVEKSIKEKNVS